MTFPRDASAQEAGDPGIAAATACSREREHGSLRGRFVEALGSPRGRLGMLLALGVVQAVLYAGVLRLSHRFIPGQGFAERPILAVLSLLGTAFVFYLISLALSVGGWGDDARREERKLTAGRRMLAIVGFALLFRGIVWGSNPIQEIDIYRYLWDGRVLAAGVNPYRFSPGDVQQYGESGDAPEALQKLAALRKSSPAISTLFSRVHFREVPTVYPPVSQLVFTIAARLTPVEAPVKVHLLVMKGVLLLFDIATIFLLVLLLKRTGLPLGWVLAYAWCPLVLKEFANSGHLDSIAVCLTTLTVVLLLPSRDRHGLASSDDSCREPIRQSLAALAWAAATLAKLYPVVLLPVILRWWYRRLGAKAMIPMMVYVIAIAAVYLPLMKSTQAVEPSPKTSAAEASFADLALPVPESAPADHDPFEGMRAFLGRWEMNDLLFAVVIENLKTPASPEPRAREPAAPWFAVLPVSLRLEIENGAAGILEGFGISPHDFDLPWMLSRGVTGGIFLGICTWLALRPWPGDGSRRLIEGVFLSLAWLWFLSPTQNPWYWTWALPFVVFAARSWLLVSGLSLVYYFRFYLLYHFETQTLGPTRYVGTELFDFVVVWFEHLPVLVLLILEGLRRRTS